MRVLKTEDCFYVSGGDAKDSTSGSFGDSSNRGESPGVSQGDRDAANAALSNGRPPGCSNALTASQYSTLATGWSQLAALSSPFAVISGVGFAVSLSAAAMSGYNNYCSWGGGGGENGSR